MKSLVAAAVGVVLLGGLAVLSGQTNTRPFTEGRSSCTPFDPTTLKLVEVRGRNWQLSRGDGAILKVFASREDADAALAVAKGFSQLCYIGKNNGRPCPQSYTMEYWK